MNRLLIGCLALIATSCAIKPSILHQYTLNTFDNTPVHAKSIPKRTILVTRPDALAGYRTEQMLYMKKYHERLAFAESGWVAPPAEQLLPLIIQSLASTHRFKAIVSSTTPETADYQLDTELIDLYQDFLQHPSQIILTVKVTLSKPEDDHIIASRMTQIRQPCPTDTPYGGVIAANAAAKKFTREMVRFVLKNT